MLDKYKHQNELLSQKRIRLCLRPLIFSLFCTLNSYAQTKDDKSDENLKSINQTEVVQDSVLIVFFENLFNQLIKQDLTESERSQINNKIIQGLNFSFNDMIDAIRKDQMYIKRKGIVIDQNLEWFLENFYKESYRSEGTLSVKVLSIYKKDKKIYIEYDYLYKSK